MARRVRAQSILALLALMDGMVLWAAESLGFAESAAAAA
jgi:hypothetical protein